MKKKNSKFSYLELENIFENEYSISNPKSITQMIAISGDYCEWPSIFPLYVTFLLFCLHVWSLIPQKSIQELNFIDTILKVSNTKYIIYTFEVIGSTFNIFMFRVKNVEYGCTL